MSNVEPAADTSPERQTAAGFGTAQVRLKPRKARPFYGRHPWVLDTAIDCIEGQPADGDVVDLVADGGKFVARGIYNSRSRIRVRLYSWDVAEALDALFWRRRLGDASNWRRRLGYDDPEGACRLVFSEGDALSGLIVDRYADWLTVQITAQAMAARLPELLPILVDQVRPRGILLRTEKGVARAEGLDLRDGLIWGEAPGGAILITENGLRYGVDLAEGQKTGFYLDQRVNRRVAASYFRNRRLLDMFCYSGGFSLNAVAHGEASSALGIDASQKAVALARTNAEQNSTPQVRFEVADGFTALEELAATNERFGAVVLDPPKFARSRQSVDDAMRAYHRLNRLAVEVLEPGGILVTCSCSGHVTREDFLFMLVGVAQQTRRNVQILEMRGAAPDHPVSATCLESEYLKCFICRVV
jgi:23S rRNA (cytosine1962-C5)-methyltransferase